MAADRTPLAELANDALLRLADGSNGFDCRQS
jgi:hypothetical protein